MVSGGHRTDPRVYDPYEKSSPTIPLEVAKIQLGLASYHDAEVEEFHIPVAYLNAYLKPDKRQVMRIVQVDPTARQFVQSDGTLLVEVLRALYGFPESVKRAIHSAQWNHACFVSQLVHRNGPSLRSMSMIACAHLPRS